MALGCHLLKTKTFRIRTASGPIFSKVISSLKSPDFIGSQHKIIQHPADRLIGPDRPSANITVASGTSEWMAVHHPQQQGFVFGRRAKQTGSVTGFPGKILPFEF
jgi:hypothetical protein